jgi:cell division protein ZapA
MPLVNVMVNSRAYTIACDEGEEEHLKELSEHVDKKVRELLETVGQVGDSRLLLMAALLVTDDYFDAMHRLEAREKDMGDLSGAHEEASTQLASSRKVAADTLEKASKRVEDIAARLAEA